MTNKITILGSGTSMGVPRVGCDCEVCTSHDPRDKRMRSSSLVEIGGKRILIDTSPELRLQCLANNIHHIDSCLITHSHADHIMGMDDLRGFTKSQKQPLDVWVSSLHYENVQRIFGYADLKHTKDNKDLPQLKFKQFEPDKPFSICGVDIVPLELDHVPSNYIGKMKSIGFRFGDLGYCTDLCGMTEEQIEILKGVKVLILGVLRKKPHPAHLNTDQAIELSRAIGADRTYFTHLGHKILHEREEKILPDNVWIAYDGLTIEW